MKKIGIVMNSIAEINFKKDSTLLLMSELQNQGKELYYIENLNLYFSSKSYEYHRICDFLRAQPLQH